MTGEAKSGDACQEQHDHPMHTEQLPRLGRIAGQIEGVRKMIEEHRHCTEIITQIRAARAALKSIEANILSKHLTKGVSDTLATPCKDARAKQTDALIKIFKRFDEQP